MELIFWISILTLFFIYVGYPVLIFAISQFIDRSPCAGEYVTSVSIIIAAHNEEQFIEATIKNKLELNYPPDLLEVIVVSDGSTDSTPQLLRKCSDPRLKQIILDQRSGKTVAINRGIQQASGEIVVISDANSMYEKNALKFLVDAFSDPDVGYATGNLVYLNNCDTVIESKCKKYMQYENTLRRLENRIGSIVGVNGGIDAVRKKLYDNVEPRFIQDFWIPLRIVERGFRVVFIDKAIAYEQSLTTFSDEWLMRIRNTLCSYHVLWDMKHLFNPLRFRFFSFELLFHKLLRYWAGFFQISALTSHLYLASTNLYYEFTAYMHTGIYVLILVSYMTNLSLKPSNKLGYGLYACLLNAAAMVAFFMFLAGMQRITWTPRKG